MVLWEIGVLWRLLRVLWRLLGVLPGVLFLSAPNSGPHPRFGALPGEHPHIPLSTLKRTPRSTLPGALPRASHLAPLCLVDAIAGPAAPMRERQTHVLQTIAPLRRAQRRAYHLNLHRTAKDTQRAHDVLIGGVLGSE